MLKIDKQQNITLTRGDTLTLTVSLYHEVPPVPPATEPTVEPYTPEADDTIRIACSHERVGDVAYELKWSATIPHDTMTVTIPAATTAQMEYKTYFYDIEITHGDGSVDTVIFSTLTITGEAK